jgi:dTDP-glucose pyrophosphorylase
MVSMNEAKIGRNASIRDAIAAIERTRRFIAAVVDDENRLLGVVSDGDIRRAILQGQTVDSPITGAMSVDPIVASDKATREELLHLMLTKGVAAVPVVDRTGRLTRIVQVTDFQGRELPTIRAEGFWGAVIMAGGEGRRLRPLTADLPKPMIEVGGVPLLERQVRALVECGVLRIFIATNYLGHLIEDHFRDGSEFGARIQYLREDVKLGTAGALSLLPEDPLGPLLVLNGDVITSSDYGKLLAYHNEQKALITMAAIEYRVEIPFGVVQVQDMHAVAIEEKPSQRFLCNAGIYALSPSVLALIPAGQPCNMTSVIERTIAGGHTVSVFPLHEYWTDIGNPHDLERAQRVFGKAHDA